MLLLAVYTENIFEHLLKLLLLTSDVCYKFYFHMAVIICKGDFALIPLKEAFVKSILLSFHAKKHKSNAKLHIRFAKGQGFSLSSPFSFCLRIDHLNIPVSERL